MKCLNDKGDIGVLNLIFTVSFILFVLIPIFSIIFEKNIMLAKSSAVIECIDTCIYSGYEALDPLAISEGDMEFNKNLKIFFIFKLK